MMCRPIANSQNTVAIDPSEAVSPTSVAGPQSRKRPRATGRVSGWRQVSVWTLPVFEPKLSSRASVSTVAEPSPAVVYVVKIGSPSVLNWVNRNRAGRPVFIAVVKQFQPLALMPPVVAATRR